jgi:hypothetical protein
MLTAVMSAVSVATVHEDVHQGARQQNEVRQRAEQMRGVLGDQVEAAYRGGSDQSPSSGGPPEGWRSMKFMIHGSVLVIRQPRSNRGSST